jgi:putative ABC transport system ATP-binding protein
MSIAPSNNGVLIECRGLTKAYHKGDVTITPLQELDLDVRAGDFLALMGPSGSGKTTLLNLIAGIDTPTGGTLRIAGTDIASLSRSRLADWRSENVGYIFQLYNLVPVLTAYENVELPLLLRRLSRRERHERVSTALELVGIADRHDHYPRQLSGGQEQRVAIARASSPILGSSWRMSPRAISMPTRPRRSWTCWSGSTGNWARPSLW